MDKLRIVFCLFFAFCLWLLACTKPTDEPSMGNVPNDHYDSIRINDYFNRAQEQSNLFESVKYVQMARNHAHSVMRYDDEVEAYLKLFNLFFYNGKNEEAFRAASRACGLADSINSPVLMANSYHAMGIILSRMGNSTLATRNFSNAFKIFISNNDTVNLLSVWRDMTRCYYESALFDSAHSLVYRCLGLDTRLGNQEGVMIDFAHVGATELATFRSNLVNPDYSCLDKALDYFTRAETRNKDFKNSTVTEITTLGFAELYYFLYSYSNDTPKNKQLFLDKSEFLFDSAMYYVRLLEDPRVQKRFDLLGMQIKLAKHNPSDISSYLDSLKLESNRSQSSNYLSKEIYLRALALKHEADGKFAEALNCIQQAEKCEIAYSSSSNALGLTIQMARGQHEGEIMRNRAREEQLKAKAKVRSIMLTIAASVLIIVGVFVVFLVRSTRRNKKLVAKVSTLYEEVLATNDELQSKNREIYDSINYASMIQLAAMPSSSEIFDTFGESLTLLRPRDIVSGDFFWASETGPYKLLVAGDCTGHGVPGALLSMLGMSILDYVTRHFGENGEVSAGHVLDRMRAYFKRTLNQSSFRTDKAIDSIDLALVVVDTNNKQLHYAAAFRPLIYFRNGELNRIKADPMPIGVYPKEKEHFTNHVVDLQPNDVFYLFSDGLPDQSGYDGPEAPMAKAFSNRRFLALLQDIYSLPFETQKYRILAAMEDWRKPKSSSQNSCSQTDDNVIVGFAVNNFLKF